MNYSSIFYVNHCCTILNLEVFLTLGISLWLSCIVVSDSFFPWISCVSEYRWIAELELWLVIKTEHKTTWTTRVSKVTYERNFAGCYFSFKWDALEINSLPSLYSHDNLLHYLTSVTRSKASEAIISFPLWKPTFVN